MKFETSCKKTRFMDCLKNQKYYLKIAEIKTRVFSISVFFFSFRNCFQFFFMYLCMFNIYFFLRLSQSSFFSACNGCTNQFLIHFRVKYFTFPFLFRYNIFWHFFSSSIFRLRFGLSFSDRIISIYIPHLGKLNENWFFHFRCK